MKNHFIMTYNGNKRAEVEQIEQNIKLDGINTIVEPFCGTSAMSYYLSITYPKRFKYVLNDNNKLLIQLYNIMRNPELLQLFEDEINEICKTLDKSKYKEITKRRGKDDETLNSWFIGNKIHSLAPYMYNLRYVYKYMNFKELPIVKFMQNPDNDITTLNMEAVELYKQYENKPDVMLFMDPPYIECSNHFYHKTQLNIYGFLCKNPIKHNTTHIVLILETNWVINFLFKEYRLIVYDKTYQTTKKKTSHMIISNRSLLQ